MCVPGGDVQGVTPYAPTAGPPPRRPVVKQWMVDQVTQDRARRGLARQATKSKRRKALTPLEPTALASTQLGGD